MNSHYKISLHQNNWYQLPQTRFRNAKDGEEISQETEVKLRADKKYLQIDFKCTENPFVNENSYTAHNSEMYNQEVFELFIASGSATPAKYLEIEINPNNALFVGWIDNPTGETPAHLDFVPHELAGVIHKAKKAKNEWSGSLRIPWQLLGRQSDNYRINFYRIISMRSHRDPGWKCDVGDCVFACWSPTNSGATPRFHIPEAFGRLQIK